MGLWLMPKPDVMEAFTCTVEHHEQIEEIIDIVRWLKLQGIVRSAIHIVNDLRAVAEQRQFPADRAPRNAPLTDELRASLRHEHGVGAWNVLGGLFGRREEVACAKKAVHQKFANLAAVEFFSQRKLAMVQRFAKVSRAVGLGEQLSSKLRGVGAVIDLLSGIPTVEHLRSTAWRSTGIKQTPAFDPGDVGLILLTPIIEASGAAVRAAVQLITTTIQQYGLDPLLAISTVTDRAVMVTIELHFDRDNHEARLQAKACAQTLTTSLAQNGWYLSRRR